MSVHGVAPAQRQLFPECGRSPGDDVDFATRAFSEEVELQLEEAQRRWNFDFGRDVPLEGKIQWTKTPSAFVGRYFDGDNWFRSGQGMSRSEGDKARFSVDFFLHQAKITGEESEIGKNQVLRFLA